MTVLLLSLPLAAANTAANRVDSSECATTDTEQCPRLWPPIDGLGQLTQGYGSQGCARLSGFIATENHRVVHTQVDAPAKWPPSFGLPRPDRAIRVNVVRRLPRVIHNRVARVASCCKHPQHDARVLGRHTGQA